jgi:hypothetical protein
MEIPAFKGEGGLAERASKKLKDSELLNTSMAGTRLRLEIDQFPLWRGNHVGVKQLVDDFAKYLYLPRVKNAQVILDAIQDGITRTTWALDTFAYGDSYNETADRYRGLEAGRRVSVQLDGHSVVVKPEAAVAHQEKEAAAASAGFSGATAATSATTAPTGNGADAGSTVSPSGGVAGPKKAVLRRFHGTARVDATRLSRDVDQIASAVVQHLCALLGAKVTVTLDVEAEMPSGAPDNVVWTVTENCRTLKFENSGFEES